MATGRMASNAPARGALRQRLAHSRPVSLLHKLTGGDRFRQSHAACQTQVKSPASHHSHLLSPGHLINHVIRAIPGHRSYLREIWLSPEDFKVLYATRDIACEGKRKVAWGAGGRHRPAQPLSRVLAAQRRAGRRGCHAAHRASRCKPALAQTCAGRLALHQDSACGPPLTHAAFASSEPSVSSP